MFSMPDFFRLTWLCASFFFGTRFVHEFLPLASLFQIDSCVCLPDNQ